MTVRPDDGEETRMKTLRSKALAAFGFGLFGTLHPHVASADPSVADKTTATQLFKEGRALLDQGHIAPACRKLEESQRLDPGGGTLLNLAICHEREGRTATAWVEFTDALGIAKKDDRAARVEFARAHLVQLEPVLSRIVVDVSNAADLPDLEIKRDGSVLAPPAWGSAIPIDPGDHVIEATAPGKQTWRQSVVIGPKGDSKTVTIPSLDDAPARDTAASAPAPPAGPVFTPHAIGGGEGLAQPAARDRPGQASGLSTAAWLSLGVGVAASGVGTYFALHALSLKNDADHNCPNDVCSALGATQNSDAIRSANYATAGFGVGALGIGLGAVLFAMAPGSHPSGGGASASRPRLAVTSGDLSVGPGRGELTIAGLW
jgi:hypothetical protein